MPLAVVATAGLLLCSSLASCAEAEKTDFRQVKGIEGFAARAKNVETVSIPGPDRCTKEKDAAVQAEAREAMAWGQAMLQDLQDLPARAEGKETALAGDALAFRDWCLETPGGGNLLLAVVAEDTAVKLLLRGLASGKCPVEDIRPLFDECSREVLTAAYCLSAFRREGVDNGWDRDVKDGDAEYIRLGAVFDAVMDDYFEGERSALLPRVPDDWDGRYKDFHPVWVAQGSLSLAFRKIALEACLAIQNAAGSIPTERLAFETAAETHAGDILRNENRMGSWTTALDVWECWEGALTAAAQ